MHDTIAVSSVRFVAASRGKVASGLLGWVSFRIGERLQVDGVSVRRTADGRRTLSFPARRDSSGRQHPFLSPMDDRTRCEIEHQVFAALDGEASARS